MPGMSHSAREEWETREGWEIEVTRPVHRYMMAPREARAILDAAGRLMAQGVSAQEIVGALIEQLSPPPAARPARRQPRSL